MQVEWKFLYELQVISWTILKLCCHQFTIFGKMKELFNPPENAQLVLETCVDVLIILFGFWKLIQVYGSYAKFLL